MSNIIYTETLLPGTTSELPSLDQYPDLPVQRPDVNCAYVA